VRSRLSESPLTSKEELEDSPTSISLTTKVLKTPSRRAEVNLMEEPSESISPVDKGLLEPVPSEEEEVATVAAEVVTEVASEKVAPEKVVPEKVVTEVPEKVAPEKVVTEVPEKVVTEKTELPEVTTESKDKAPEETTDKVRSKATK